jgi:very-long-chain enoyl-CoA reductase
MRPRVHNVLSYSLTLLVFWAVLLWRAPSAGLNANAELGAALWSAHFLRRTLESAFVHRYSKPSIGPGDYLTEYIYYWGFAAWIAWSLAAPSHRAQSMPLQLAGMLVFALAEAGNARAHWMLRGLRRAGTNEKLIPRGFLFEWVSCPHYLCEILSWVGFNLATQTLAGLAFMLVGAGILGAWAHTRHVAYKKDFAGQGAGEIYPSRRRALFPGIF